MLKMSMKLIIAFSLALLTFSLLINHTAARCEDEKDYRYLCRRVLIGYGKKYLCGDASAGSLIDAQKHCRKTCGLCQPTEPVCSRSGYGCCWDKKTSKLYADGRNCPVCKDLFPIMCSRFKKFCKNELSVSYDYIHTACPETCGDCPPPDNSL